MAADSVAEPSNNIGIDKGKTMTAESMALFPSDKAPPNAPNKLKDNEPKNRLRNRAIRVSLDINKNRLLVKQAISIGTPVTIQ